MSSQLLQRFTSEARDLLEGASAGLLALEKQPGDEAIINNVFRSVHTLKGSVGLFDYPAFLKLVHAGEDVLSAIRGGQMNITSDIVDLLLDSLDHVSAWVDAIERSGDLPTGADGISKTTSEALRALLPSDFGSGDEAAKAAVAGLSDLTWIKALPERERLLGAKALAEGQTLLAVEYAPVDDCFFSGEDPFNLLRQVEPLTSLAIKPKEPWPALVDLDAFKCVLRFRMLTPMAQADVEHLFRYSIEAMRLSPVSLGDLISLEGRDGVSPVHQDFAGEAQGFIAARDWQKLARGVAAVRSLTNGELRFASGIRWLEAALAFREPDPRVLGGLIASMVSGEPFALASATAAQKSDGAQASGTGSSGVAFDQGAVTLSALAREMLEGQRTMLRHEMAEDAIVGNLRSVVRTVGNVLSAHGLKDAAGRWRAGAGGTIEGDQAQAQAKVLGLLEDLLQSSAPSVAAPQGAASPDVDDMRAEAAGAVGDQKHARRVLKVDQAKVDKLMNLIGELVVSKNSLPFLSKRAEEVYGSREMGREIKDLFAVVDRLAQEMQTAIMDVRMLPISEVLDRFPRLVRDVARKLGKQVDLVIEGAETAADKNMIEVLGDPLLHIVRNSLDHGIELPADRIARGKPATATVTIRAFQESDEVVIEVRDDGRGIDPARIRSVAVARGVIDEAQAARLSDQEAINLVFAPGFSTAEKVSDLSGRGVGMDVVRSAIEKAGGAVSLETQTGAGTIVRLSLPLSMAITRVMVVEAAGGNVFGIPMDHIAETVRISRAQVHTVKQSEVFVLREAIVPLLRLDQVLGLARPAWFGDVDQEEAVLVVRINGALTGLVVDNFRERMDIILKPFEGLLADIPGYSGTALLGDGQVLLVLNLKELI